MEKSGFFAYIDGSSNEYTDEFLADWVASFIGNGVYNGSLAVIPADGMAVTIQPGKAWINGRFYHLDSPLTIPVEMSDGKLNRYTSIMIRADKNELNITAKAVNGEYSAKAVVPNVIRNSEIYDLDIADIYVAAGTTQITQSQIIDRRLDTDVCGIVTGIINQVDTSTLYRQIEAWYIEYKGFLAEESKVLIQSLKDEIDGIEQGSEVMLKTVYDPDGDGVIDIATHAISADTATDQTARDAADTAQTAAAKAQAKADAAMPKTGGTFTGSIAAPQVGVTRLHLTNLDNYGLKCDTATGYNLLWAIAGTKIVDKSGTLKQIAASNISGASSIRYKHDVADLAQETARKLLETRPVQFVYNAEMGDPGVKYGLIAEDMEKTDKTACYYNAQGQVEGINYTMLVAPLIKLCQLQQDEINALAARVEKLEGLEKEKTK